MLRPSEFHIAYRSLLHDLLDSKQSVEEVNERTGVRVRSLIGAEAFKLDLGASLRLPTCGVRRTFPRVAAAEVMWMWLGLNDERWLRERGVRIWSKFTEEGTSIVQAAYGWRWRTAFGRDQIQLAIEALRSNQSDRRVWVSAWDPRSDGLGRPSKNVPCPVGFSFTVVGGALHHAVTVRSSDVFVGLPYDVMGHAMLASIVAEKVGLLPGTMTFTLCHPHLYEPHWHLAREAVLQPAVVPDVRLLRLGEKTADEFIDAYELQQNAAKWPGFNPQPVLIE